MHDMMRHRALLSLLLVGLVAGCAKPALIPNTHVKDTKENREVLSVLETYRKAMEARDAAGVLALVHPTYEDNAGTPEGSDDVDFNRLKAVLGTRFRRANQIRYRIEYQAVRITGASCEVDSYVDATFVYEPESGPPRWRRLTDYARFRMVRDGERWKFVGGL